MATPFTYASGEKETFSGTGTPAPQNKFSAGDANSIADELSDYRETKAELFEVPADYRPGFPGGSVLEFAAWVYSQIGTTPPVLTGWQNTGWGDSQFNAGFQYGMDQRFPDDQNAQFTYPGQGTQYLISQVDVPVAYGSAFHNNGISFRAWRSTTKNTDLHIYIGTNDVVGQGQTAAYVQGKITEMVTLARTIGYSKIAVYTLTSLNNGSGTASVDVFEAKRLPINAFLRSKTNPSDTRYACGADAIGDIGSTAELGQRDSSLDSYWFHTTNPVTAVDYHWYHGIDIVFEIIGTITTRFKAGETGFLVNTHTQVQPGQGYTPGTFVNANLTGGGGAVITGDSWADGGSGGSKVRDTRSFPGDGAGEIELDRDVRGAAYGLRVPGLPSGPNDFPASIVSMQDSYTLRVQQGDNYIGPVISYNTGDKLRPRRVGNDAVFTLNGEDKYTVSGAFTGMGAVTLACYGSSGTSGGKNMKIMSASTLA